MCLKICNAADFMYTCATHLTSAQAVQEINDGLYLRFGESLFIEGNNASL